MKASIKLAAAALAICALGAGCDESSSRAPVAVDDTVSVVTDTVVDIAVLANDVDARPESLAIVSFTQPADGAATDNGDGTLRYTPTPGFSGFAFFTYTVKNSDGRTDTATVSVLVGVTVQLQMTEARGLFKAGLGGVGVYQDGYLSEDDQGRIYANHAYTPGAPATTVWTKDRQYVDIMVSVQPADATWPGEARIVWELVDVDDPSNEDPFAHDEAWRTLDPNDYNGRDDDADGFRDVSDGNDNTGGRDGRPAWEEIDPAYALSGGNATAFAGGLSGVRFNATDDGGDNFVVKASIRLIPGGELLETQQTGVMTVWKRVDLEYVVMDSAAPLVGVTDGQANQILAKAFVELVPYEQAVPDVVVDGKLQMGRNMYDASRACEDYVSAENGRFTREGQSGWFFCAAANYFVDPGEATTPLLYYGEALVWSDGLTLQLPTGASLADDDKYEEGAKLASLPPAGGYRVMKTDMVLTAADLFKDGTVLYDYDPYWDTFDGRAPVITHTPGAAGDGAEVTYGADADATDGDILVFKEFVSAVYMQNPGDSSQHVAFRYDNFSWTFYQPTFQVWSKDYSTPTVPDYLSFGVTHHGYPSGSEASIQILGTGALVVGGISPGPHGGLEGRTIVFTASRGNLETFLHELGHAFGFHHICGNWDYKSDDTAGQACAMHYSSWYFMLDHSKPRRLDLWTHGHGGPHYCEEHIVEIREQNLEDLAKLEWGVP